ncbi:MAG: hypothetical protein ABI604_11235 [Nitrospirota bacterium]
MLSSMSWAALKHVAQRLRAGGYLVKGKIAAATLHQAILQEIDRQSWPKEAV